MTKASLTFLLALCYLAAGVQCRLVWPFSDPFDRILHPTGGDGPSNPVATSPNPVTSSSHKSAPTVESSDTSADTSSSKTSEAEIRKLIAEELKKFQKSSGVSKSDKGKEDAPAETEVKTTANPADLLRRIIAEELAKALPQTPSTPEPEPPTPPQPIWKQWVNTKNWAKSPGPNGQEPPGFIGTLRSRYGGSGEASPYGYRGGQAPPTGSPHWVWSQISSKWSSKDPTVVPPSQIVDQGDWESLLPPHKAVPANKTA
ncbi:uncharacterized protein [Rhodnius prolixus]